jgi:outer membrane autotransporter protein
MTKNKFLSKKLACILTTALISLNPLSAFSAVTTINAAGLAVGDNGNPEGYDFTHDSTLTIGGTVAQTFAGAITNTTTSFGTVSITNTAGVVTFNGAVGQELADRVKVVTIGRVDNVNSVVVFNGLVHAVTLTTNGDAFYSVNGNTATTFMAGANSLVMLGRGITNGETAFVSNTRQNFTAGSRLVMPVTMVDGQTIKLFTGTIIDNGAGGTDAADAAAMLAETRAALQNTSLFTYTAAGVGTTEVTVTAAARTISDVESTLSIDNNKASAFIQAHAAALANSASDAGTINAFEDLFGQGFGRTQTEDTKLSKQISPQTDTITGSTVAAKAVTSGVQNVISTRLASLRSGDAYSAGVVTGSGMSANSGFIQAFGSTVEQKNKGNESGYDADTTGFAIGFDTKVPGGAVVGISYAHSEADVDGKGTGRSKNDIKTDSVSLYADYATKGGYVEGSITYGKSDNKGSRIVNTAGLNRTYNSNYDGEQYSFRLSGGIPQSLGGGAFFTPFAAATISQIKADAYTEKSTTENDSLRLRVAQDTVDSQVGTVGVKFHQAIKDGKTTFTPEVKLAVNQEFGDDTITTTNTYQGGGASFKNSTAIEKTSATAGVGLNISSDNVSFNIGYEADVREDYLGHSAQAKITAKF